MLGNEEIRNLKEGTLYNVAQILDTAEDWKRFMALIPNDPLGDNFVPKYNNEHIRLIEEHSRKTGEKCSKILFDEWGTSGRVRPTLRTLMGIARRADMIRVTDEIARLLGEAPPPRPQYGPGVPIDTNFSTLLLESKLQAQTTAQMKSVSNMIQFSQDTASQGNDSTAPMQTENNERNNTTQSTTPNVTSASDSNDTIPTTESEYKPNKPDFSKLMVSPYHTETGSKRDEIKNYKDNKNTSGNLVESETSGTTGSCYQQSLPNIDVFQRIADFTEKSDENLSLSSRIDQSILQDTNLILFNYGELQDVTGNFSQTVLKGPCGLMGKIGQGGFGEVFVGSHATHGQLAIKRTHPHVLLVHKPELVVKLFNSEVKYLSQFRHKNIVPIIGFSKDGPALCIVCEYIDGGSLEQKLEERVLNEKQRINIMQGTADGLEYLHSYKLDSLSLSSNSSGQSVSKSNFVHRDVKSANILLTKDLIPKLCHFGLARQYGATFITSAPMGTSTYMAPESLTGTITQKIDIYSYGIVLLELLTGLKSIVYSENGEIQIKVYVYEEINKYGKSVNDLLDTSAGVWTKAEEIFSLAKKCLEYEREDRPSSKEICKILHNLNEN